MMNIGLDMMGGDFAPLEAVKGIKSFYSPHSSNSSPSSHSSHSSNSSHSSHSSNSSPSSHSSPSRLFLFGNETEINQLLKDNQIPTENISVIPSSQVIGMHEHPTKALKEKTQSSIAVGFQYLATGKIDAFISAGNTGAMLVGTLFSIKAMQGVLRPTISTIIPKENGKTGLLLDVGLNADCKPEHLNQFAILGSLYAKHILGIENPRVGLINVGEEEGKGNLLAQAAYSLLKENKQINFTGNIEGRDVFVDTCDVMVCEGFTGNIILKLAESIYDITKRKQIDHEYFDLFNFENYGGTPVLGVSKPVIIGHGISHALAFKNMIILAEKMLESQLLAKIQQSFN